ncbi:MAG: BrnA antitoxin family protein [Roseiarcus sp.]|jgi:uncharacterized protein (DUF4415 family)|uniref:BrnA antitoxin family protein n=1 Tax=Roseiarcus sp. TaxID=1969460 RepID=UPI003C600151
MKRPEVVRTVLVDGRLYLRNADETLTPLRNETDYARLDALSPAENESIADNDIEGAPMSDEEWARVEIRQPVKKPVGLKLDDDVLSWFKSQGRGYQTHINAVLRRYVEARRKAG